MASIACVAASVAHAVERDDNGSLPAEGKTWLTHIESQCCWARIGSITGACCKACRATRACTGRFLAALGHTPHEEIRGVRLKRARELLAETDLTVEAIAERCGFRHGEYLGAVFLSQFGQTPGQFRAQQRSRGDRLDRRLQTPI